MNKRFHYAGLSIGVSCDDASHLAWLEEFLSPPFRVTSSGLVHCEVRLRFSEVDFAEYRGHDRIGDRIACYALDTRIIRHPLLASPSDRLVLDEEFDLLYCVSRGCREIEIIAPSNGRLMRIPLMRVVREIAMNHARDRGGLLLHAASCAIGGVGIIIGGSKEAGKTSLLIHLLQSTPARFLSNDRTWISYHSAAPMHTGVPTIITLREATFEFFPDLLGQVQKKRYQFLFRLEEAEKGLAPEPRPAADGRYGLSPIQFCRLVGCEPEARTPAGIAIFPRITDRRGPIRLVPLSVRESADRLEQILFGTSHGSGQSKLFRLSPEPQLHPQDAQKNPCHALAGLISCYECEIGPHSYASRGSTAERIQKVLERTHARP
jgi:hypothetical protein